MRNRAEQRLLPHQDDADPQLTAKLFWEEIAHSMREGLAIRPEFARHASDALDACVQDPEHAGRHLGLLRSKGAPRKDAGYAALAREVQSLLEQGIPLRFGGENSKGKSGALAIVAERHGVDETTVRRAWNRFKRSADRRFVPAFPELLPPNPQADRVRIRKERKSREGT